MFTLRTLLIVVAVAALGAAGLVYRTSWWEGIIVSLMLCVLAFGLLRIYSHPEKRSFWVPVSIVGFFYMALAFVDLLSLRASLITSRLIFDAWYAIHGQELMATLDEPSDEVWYYWFHNLDLLSFPVDHEILIQFRRVYNIAQSLITLALAFGVGGTYSWAIGRKKRIT